jgi:Zn-dependent protease with chaperone function
MLILLVVVGVSWRWEWVGGVVFTGLAFAYSYFARNHPSWILAIACPLLVVGILFFWSWLQHRELRADA